LRDPDGKGPNLSFQARQTRAPRRSWIHLDLYTERQNEEVNRLLQLGARRYPWRYRPGSDFVVLEDPDGKSFLRCPTPVALRCGSTLPWESWRNTYLETRMEQCISLSSEILMLCRLMNTSRLKTYKRQTASRRSVKKKDVRGLHYADAALFF
jgi:Glyoxalase-like domain